MIIRAIYTSKPTQHHPRNHHQENTNYACNVPPPVRHEPPPARTPHQCRAHAPPHAHRRTQAGLRATHDAPRRPRAALGVDEFVAVDADAAAVRRHPGGLDRRHLQLPEAVVVGRRVDHVRAAHAPGRARGARRRDLLRVAHAVDQRHHRPAAWTDRYQLRGEGTEWEGRHEVQKREVEENGLFRDPGMELDNRRRQNHSIARRQRSRSIQADCRR